MKINPNTEKGKTQLATIKWCEDQFNEGIKQYFNDKYRLMRGFHLNFKIALDLNLDETVKMEIAELVPTTKETLKKAIKEAKGELNGIN